MEATIQASDLQINRWFTLCDMPVRAVNFEGLISLHNDLEYLQPIHLTEDILLKCGFKRKEIYLNDFFIKGMTLHFSNGNCNWGSVKIKYLHQVQNLYFALTNTELEIQL